MATQSDDVGNTKTVFLVRHAESNENAKLSALRSSWQERSWTKLQHGLSILWEPSLIDTCLSERGKAQVESLSLKMEESNFFSQHSVELAVHSPLIRARETCLGILKSANDLQVVVEDSIHEKYLREWLPGMESSLESRIREFESFIHSREEKVIMVVGHSQFFRKMLGMQDKFKNCDVWKVTFSSNHDTGSKWLDPVKLLDVPFDL